MILVVMEQWSQAACANCEVFFRNIVVKTESQRKVQSPHQTFEYIRGTKASSMEMPPQPAGKAELFPSAKAD